MKKKNPIKWFIYFLVVILILILLGFGLMFGYQKFIVEPKNETTIIQQNITQVTNVLPGEHNIWDTLIVFIISGVILIVIIFALVQLRKILTSRKMLTTKGQEICSKKAHEKLKDKFQLPDKYEEHKWSKRGYGGDVQENEFYVFIFYKKLVNPLANIKTVDKFNLVSCRVDTKTLDITRVRTDFGIDDLLNELNKERTGKDGTPEYGVETKKPDSMFSDLFGGDSSVSVTTDTPKVDEEEV